MKTDLYTKSVLTLIAVALLYLCFVKSPQLVRADSPQKTQDTQPQRVVLVGVDGAMPLPVIVYFVNDQGGTSPAGTKTPVPVTMAR